MPNAVAVVLPVLDEAEALAWLLPRVPSSITPIVVDNGSADSSAEVAGRLGARVVVEPVTGFGAACWAGLRAAEGHEIVAFMDADGSLDPAQLHRVTRPVASGGADLVLGRRVPRERGAMATRNRAANACLAWVLRRRHGVAVRDLGPMRAARRAALLELGIVDRRSGWPLEMVTRAAGAGWRISEVGVDCWRRKGGQSKVSGTVMGTARAVLDMSNVIAGRA